MENLKKQKRAGRNNGPEEELTPEIRLALFRDEIQGLKIEEDFQESAGKRKTAHFEGQLNLEALGLEELALWEGFKEVLAGSKILIDFQQALDNYRNKSNRMSQTPEKKSRGMILSYLTNKITAKVMQDDLDALEA